VPMPYLNDVPSVLYDRIGRGAVGDLVEVFGLCP